MPTSQDIMEGVESVDIIGSKIIINDVEYEIGALTYDSLYGWEISLHSNDDVVYCTAKSFERLIKTIMKKF